jgi:hypothetical protein
VAGFYVHKTPAIQNIKLKPRAKRFNVRFYCNDGISYYLRENIEQMNTEQGTRNGNIEHGTRNTELMKYTFLITQYSVLSLAKTMNIEL